MLKKTRCGGKHVSHFSELVRMALRATITNRLFAIKRSKQDLLARARKQSKRAALGMWARRRNARWGVGRGGALKLPPLWGRFEVFAKPFMLCFLRFDSQTQLLARTRKGGVATYALGIWTRWRFEIPTALGT